MNALRTLLAAGLLISLALAGCAGAVPPSPSPTTPPPTDPPPTEVPGGLDSPSVGPGGGMNPIPGQPDLVVPMPGTINPQPVSIETLEAQIDGRRVVILATWTSGVQPCYQLDTVAVKQDGNAFTISMLEGSGQADAMCIEIAMQHATAIDLGELDPGDYTVEAQDGPATPLEITIS